MAFSLPSPSSLLKLPIPGSWRIAARITSLQYFLLGALTRKKIPLLTALPGSSIKIIRDLRKPHAAFVCLHAFVIAAFQFFNMCHRVKSCMNFEVGGFQNRGVCPQAFPPSLLSSPLLLFFALALFLAGNACYAGYRWCGIMHRYLTANILCSLK